MPVLCKVWRQLGEFSHIKKCLLKCTPLCFRRTMCCRISLSSQAKGCEQGELLWQV